jgi:ABC-2 type transport system ATP-binding protein
MPRPALATFALTKRFGSVCALEHLEIRVEPGEIYGFLGRNGAGKTTTIRLLLGMIRPSEGRAEVFGSHVHAGSDSIWRRVGHLVETAAAYPELTTRENLDVALRLQQRGDPPAVGRVIEQLGLSEYADRRAGTLSLGNLQRLALARALVHEPDLLVLDEPANALDPAGVVEIRELLRRLARERGVTVFMSSHMLPEVERLADRIGIVHRGRLVEERSAAELEHWRRRRLEVTVGDVECAERALRAAGMEVVRGGNADRPTLGLHEKRPLEHPEEIATLLVRAGAPPKSLVIVQEDIEEHFLRLTGESAER